MKRNLYPPTANYLAYLERRKNGNGNGHNHLENTVEVLPSPGHDDEHKKGLGPEETKEECPACGSIMTLVDAKEGIYRCPLGINHLKPWPRRWYYRLLPE